MIELIPMALAAWFAARADMTALEAPRSPAIEVYSTEILAKPPQFEEFEANTTQTTSGTKNTPNWLNSCILGLRHFGVEIYGDAKDIKPNSMLAIGSVVKFYYKHSDTYHASLITSFTDEGFMVKETNYKKGKYTEREVEWNDPAIIGFYAVP